MDACRNPKCVKTRTKTNELLKDNEEAKNRVVSLEKVVASQKKQIQVLEAAKREATDAMEVARAEVHS